MQLKKITLNNIRSYKNQEFVFPKGSTLLSGDIGCGKTSILLGIEFALFGLQPGQKGTSLLRNGSDSGKVSIEFEIDNNEIIIERLLKRGKAISQDKCFVTIDGLRREISVMELKSLVLKYLSYPKEFSKKQNLLYKFTVYTPQEEMKQIILQDPETRINTLRHIFGIDKYKKVFENTSLLSSKIREERRMKEGVISNVQEEKFNLEKKENELEEKQYNLVSVEKELFIKTDEMKKAQEEKDSIKEKLEEKNNILREIETSKIVLSNKKENVLNNSKMREQLDSQIREMEDLKFNENEFVENEKLLESKKKDKEKINENLISVSFSIKNLNDKISENESVKTRIAHLETCPTCMQSLDSEYRENILSKSEREIRESMEKINELNKDKESFLENSTKLNAEINSLEEKIRDMNLIKIKREGLEGKRKEILELENLNLSLNAEIRDLETKITGLNSSMEQFKIFDDLFREKEQKYELALREERLAEIKTAELKKEIQLFSIQIGEIKERIKKSEEVRKQIDYMIKVENWLSGDFHDIVTLIEKNIMIKLKSEFSKIFSQWFSMLVSETFNVYVRDDFTPVIEQQDYEIDYNYLSGGERTAVALAYRLALNQVINSVMSEIKTKDLVILDEPTDGFSDAQLDKMRDVLEQLNVAQLIIVSHEQKIEGFVQNIINIKKENGESVVDIQTPKVL